MSWEATDSDVVRGNRQWCRERQQAVMSWEATGSDVMRGNRQWCHERQQAVMSWEATDSDVMRGNRQWCHDSQQTVMSREATGSDVMRGNRQWCHEAVGTHTRQGNTIMSGQTQRRQHLIQHGSHIAESFKHFFGRSTHWDAGRIYRARIHRRPQQGRSVTSCT